MYQKLKNLKSLKGSQKVLCNVSVKEELTKTAKPYLNMILFDEDTKISIKVWNNDDRYEELSKIPQNSLAEAEVTFEGVNKGYDNYSLQTLTTLSTPSLIDCVEIEPLKNELREIIRVEFENEDIKEIILNLFKNNDLKEKIFTSPLTEKSGYSFKGGLLAHIVRNCKLTIAICDVFDNWNYNKEDMNEKLNKDILLGACILSDIGSAFCLEIIDDVVGKTFKGNLNESSFYTCKVLVDLLKESSMPESQKDYFEHVITSSKGKLIYGAINTPRSKEANVFHYIERIDTLMGNFEFMKRIAFSDFSKIGEKQYCVVDFDEI